MIDTRRLRTLRAVADHGTVTAAAAALHLTPSAVSQQLGALEHEVGHRLFARDGRGIRLTAVGRIMLGHADEVLAQLERAEAEVAAYTTGSAGEVSVASFATAISAVLAPAVRALRLSAPALKIRVLDAEGDRGLTMLLDDQADLAIAVEYRGAPDDQRLTRIPLYAEPFDLLLPHEHAPASTLAELAGDDWIGPYPGNPVHDVITFACERGLHARLRPLLRRLPRGRRPGRSGGGRGARAQARAARPRPVGRDRPADPRARAPCLRRRPQGRRPASPAPPAAHHADGEPSPGLSRTGRHLSHSAAWPRCSAVRRNRGRPLMSGRHPAPR
ncbi:LysR family transcriptional regulator [Nonomuraea recticatena]